MKKSKLNKIESFFEQLLKVFNVNISVNVPKCNMS